MPGGTAWTSEEDERLAQLVQIHGPKKWSLIATQLETKGSKQCRRRWKNFIALEERKQGSWTPEEDAQLLDGHRRHGNKWTMIAQEIGGRTDNAVKNRFAALEKKRKGLEEPSGRVVAQRINDLGVRRIIHKDQPRHTVAEGAWLAQQQLQYSCPPGLVAQQTGDGVNGVTSRKPELVINIPCGTVAEIPYSQQPQGLAQFRSDKPCHNLSAVEVNNQSRPDDDGSMLSTSRQAAQNALAALASPGDEPGTITSLYRFFYSATPHETQQGHLASGRRSPPPWLPQPEPQLQGAPQHSIQLQQPPPLQLTEMLQPPIAVASAVAPVHPQQQLYQQLAGTTGQPHLPDPQVPVRQPLMQLPGIQQEAMYASEVMLQSSQQQGLYLPQQAAIHHGCQQNGSDVARGLEFYQVHAPPTSTAGPAVSCCPQAGKLLQLSTSLEEPQTAESRYPVQEQFQHTAPWQQQTVGCAPAHGAVSHVSIVPAASMPATMTAANIPQLQQGQQQQQQEQKQWGPEELRQLLDILGDQPALQQDAGHAVCAVATTAVPKACGPITAAICTGLDQASTGHIMHRMCQPEVTFQGLVQQEAAF